MQTKCKPLRTPLRKIGIHTEQPLKLLALVPSPQLAQARLLKENTHQTILEAISKLKYTTPISVHVIAVSIREYLLR